MHQPITGQAAILFFRSARKYNKPQNTKVVEDIEILHPVKFRLRFQSRSRKCLIQSEARAAILFFQSARKHKLGRGCWDFASCYVMFALSEKKSKMSQSIRGHGGHLVFQIGQKNTKLVEDVEILIPVKFCWIPWSSLRRPDAGHVVTIVHLSPLAWVHLKGRCFLAINTMQCRTKHTLLYLPIFKHIYL